ncbi:TPA: acetylglutamate kinase [Bacillus toyonensis]|uniref:acetylglutamate kinase n=1 Tax=Bacillus cereus group TaxID=86661 RepID=UPI00028A83A0|nr:acetylglutamate kinase [Bacillus toyonensis]AFU14844.1 Acetylglutamate kinase [Bacillus thuringiensis MC28]OTW87716.1 acetylglutamate kinase [Bacillus thuringiensis serovar cameroun]OTX08136.1 acetylglutamate kinase [Bacillus thuringiensis serovar seoulensis]QPW47025.1 acetylglutamate kinase [Bacillus thuringiensis]MCA1044971.1 acetylglutamate kinase [Bacillus toyonensis]
MSDYIVIKCGGSMLNQLNHVFFDCIKKLQQKYKVVIVHGGGPEIDAKLKECHIKVEKRDGLRVTPKEVRDVVQMVLCGSTNKKFVMNLQKHNLLAVGLSGCDGNLLQVQPVSEEIGYVGEVSYVETTLLKKLIDMNYIPVIAPIGINGNEVYNINADTAAAGIADALSAKELIFITDVDGILHEGKLVKKTDEPEIVTFIEKGVITGGMIPKVRAALTSLKMGVQKVSIVNGTKDFTKVTGECIGTTVTKGVSIV